MNGREIVGAVIETVIKIVVMALILMYIYKYAFVVYDYGYRIFGETPVDSGTGRTVSVTVSSADDAEDIGKMLEQKGLIRDARLFVIQEKLSGLDDGIPAGTYELSTTQTIEEMLEVFATEKGLSEEELSEQNVVSNVAEDEDVKEEAEDAGESDESSDD